MDSLLYTHLCYYFGIFIEIKCNITSTPNTPTTTTVTLARVFSSPLYAVVVAVVVVDKNENRNTVIFIPSLAARLPSCVSAFNSTREEKKGKMAIRKRTLVAAVADAFTQHNSEAVEPSCFSAASNFTPFHATSPPPLYSLSIRYNIFVRFSTILPPFSSPLVIALLLLYTFSDDYNSAHIYIYGGTHETSQQQLQPRG